MSHDPTQSDDYIPPELIGATQRMTPEQFETLCREYRKLRLELTSTGELIIMPFNGLESARRNANLTCQLVSWSKEDGGGVCFGSSTIFALPNGAWRMADASWYQHEKWDRLTNEEKEDFARFCPDFVVELRSSTDELAVLLSKMSEYIANGASLSWLIDPSTRRIYVYRPNEEVVVLENPESVSGEPLLHGFALRTANLW